MVTIKLSNKVFYTLVFIIILVGIGGVVYAYQTQLAPSVMGHSYEELGIQGSGYSIFVLPSGESYRNCVTTCNNQMQILPTSSPPTCFSYTNGQKMGAYEQCPSGKVECGQDVSGSLTIPRIYLYCATKQTLQSTNLGEIVTKIGKTSP